MTTGRHQDRSPVLSIDDPVVGASFDRLDRFAQRETGPAPPQEIIVELAAEDAVADCSTVVDLHARSADPSDAEARHRLENAVPAVFFHVELEIVDNAGSDPSGAEFAAGEFGLVDDQHVESSAAAVCPRRSIPPGPHR